MSQKICVHFRSNSKTKFLHLFLWIFFLIYFFSHNNLSLIFNNYYFNRFWNCATSLWGTGVLKFLLVLQDGFNEMIAATASSCQKESHESMFSWLSCFFCFSFSLFFFYLPCRKGVCCSVLVILFVWVKVFISWWSTIADNIIDIKNIVSLAWDVNSLQDRQCCFDWFHSKQETEFLDYLDAQEVITLTEDV